MADAAGLKLGGGFQMRHKEFSRTARDAISRSASAGRVPRAGARRRRRAVPLTTGGRRPGADWRRPGAAQAPRHRPAAVRRQQPDQRGGRAGGRRRDRCGPFLGVAPRQRGPGRPSPRASSSAPRNGLAVGDPGWLEGRRARRSGPSSRYAPRTLIHPPRRSPPPRRAVRTTATNRHPAPPTPPRSTRCGTPVRSQSARTRSARAAHP